MRPLVILSLTLAYASAAAAPSSAVRDLSTFFRSHNGCFVLYDSQADTYLRHNPTGCTQSFSPCSTFKIPHTLIALDSGVASGPDFSLSWNGVKRSIPAWNRDQTLQSAFANSVVWFYQELARRIGLQRENQFLQKLAYGNMDTTGGLTNFWLQSSLTISPDEQVAFLRRLWAGSLPITPNAQRATRDIMKISEHDGRAFYGKTGSGKELGWFVGCVQRGQRTVLFATRITGGPDATGKEARRISEAILEHLGI